MAVDVSRIPNNNKFDPVREAILQLQTEIEDTGATIGNGTLTISTSSPLTGSGTFTANQTGPTSISIGIDGAEYLTNITHDTVNQKLVVTYGDGTTADLSLAQYIDDTNLARLVSGSLDNQTGIATFTRDDATTFTVDLSALFDDTDTNDFLTSASFDDSNGIITFGVTNQTSVTVDIDGRYPLVGDLTAVSDNIITSADFSATSNRFKLTLTQEDAGTIEASFDDVVLSESMAADYIPYVKVGGGDGDTTNAVLNDSFLKINGSTLELDWDTGNPLTVAEHDLKMRKDGGGSGTYYQATYAADSVSFLHYASSLDIDTAKIGATTTGRIRINDTYSLPASDGTSGQVLTTDGSGDLSWADASGGGSLNLQDVTDNGRTTDKALVVTAVDDAGNVQPSANNIRVSGYGIIGNRGTFYVTNGGGSVQIGNGTIHNQNPTALFESSLISLYRPTSVTGNITFTDRLLKDSNSASDTINIRAASSGQYFRLMSGNGGFGIADSEWTHTLEFANYGPSTGNYSRIHNNSGKTIQIGSAINHRVNLTGMLEVGTFSQSQTNSGEAWIGRAADRVAGTLTVQLGTGTGRRFEVVDYGWTTVEFSADDSGIATANSSFRAPIFYDSNDTNYYCDPASTSNLNSLTVNGTFTVVNGTINMNNNDGFVYDDGANVMKVKYDGTEYAIWTQANDGSGSGLDADLLDGNHGTYFDHRRYTDSSNYLGGYYVSGGTEKPNSSVFGAGKLKIAMLRGGSPNLGFGGTWNDVLWMSTYTGSDVKRSTALVSSKYDDTSLWIAKQNYDATDWGTGYLIWNSGNDGSGSGLDADNLDGFTWMDSGKSVRGDYIYVGSGGGYFYNDSGSRIRTNHDFYTNNGNTYLYSNNLYLGDSSGDTVHVRGNYISGNNWYIGTDGGARFKNIDISGSLSDTIQNKTAGGNLWLQYGHNGTIGLGYGGGLTTAYGGLTVKGQPSNTPSEVSANIGTYAGTYAFIDLATSHGNGGWIDFSKADGGDYAGRIRYYNTSGHMSFYAEGSNEEFRVYSSYTLALGSSRAPIFYDSNNTGYYIHGDSTSRLNLLNVNAVGTSVAGIGKVMFPYGAEYNSGSTTGAIKITLPQSWTNTMMTMKITIFDYSINESFEVHCGGYNYAGGGGSWVNTHAKIIANPHLDRNFNVRFGHDGSKCCILIGETNSAWAYPKVVVTEWVGGHSNETFHKWDNGWDISIVTTLPSNIDQTRSNNQLGRTTNLLALPYYNGGEMYLRQNTHWDSVSGIDVIGGAGEFRFSSNTGNLNVRTDGWIHAHDNMKAPIFYDSNNTGYYIHGDSTSRLYNLNVTHFGVVNTSQTSRDGISLYGGYSGGEPTYGILFSGTTGFGGHGSVTSDWATYFTMNNNNSRGWIFRRVGSGNCASISGGGTASFNGDVIAYYSDMRLKTKLGDIEDPIGKIQALNGFYYEPNEVAESYGYEKETRVGLSAQEVEAVLPEIVTDAPIGDGYKTVDYAKLVPVLVEAIKEQQKQIDELKSLINKS